MSFLPVQYCSLREFMRHPTHPAFLASLATLARITRYASRETRVRTISRQTVMTMWARHPGLGMVHIPPSVPRGSHRDQHSVGASHRSSQHHGCKAEPPNPLHRHAPMDHRGDRTRKPRRLYFSLPPRHHAEQQRPYPENTVALTTSASRSPAMLDRKTPLSALDFTRFL